MKLPVAGTLESTLAHEVNQNVLVLDVRCAPLASLTSLKVARRICRLQEWSVESLFFCVR